MNEPEAVAWMGRVVELSRSDGSLPDPVLIWWKARLLERRDAQARAVRPAVIAQWLSLAVAVVATTILCATGWDGIRGMLASAGLAPWAVAGGVVGFMALALRSLLAE